MCLSPFFDVAGLEPVVNSSHNQCLQGRAAVLVPLVKHEEGFSLLLTKRAIHMSHHGGEIAFPGGMWEPGDAFPVMTALREAEEEVALPVNQVQVVGQLSPLDTRNGTMVTPVVAMIPHGLSLVPSPDEIEQLFYVPVSRLLLDSRIRTDIFQRNGLARWVPAFDYQGHEIWGFTAAVIIMLLTRCFGANFPRKHPAPEKYW